MVDFDLTGMSAGTAVAEPEQEQQTTEIKGTIEKRPDNAHPGEQAADDTSGLPWEGVPEGINEQQSEPEPVAEHDDLFFERMELLGQLSDIVRRRQEAFATWGELKAETKRAKSRYDELAAEEQDLTAELADLMSGKRLPKKPETAQAGPSTDENDGDTEEWRKTSTRELLNGAEGIGAKKLDAIVELAPTVGDLQDLRAEASQEYKPFKDKLPKGCGQKIADAIEDLVLDHSTKFSTPSAAEQIKQNQPKPTVKPDVETPTQEPAAQEQDADAWAAELVEEIREEARDQDWGMLECDFQDEDTREGETEATLAGFDAQQDGKNWNEFPRKYDRAEIEQWITGWCCGEYYEILKKRESGGTPKTESDFSKL